MSRRLWAAAAMLAQTGPDFLARVGMEFFCAVPTNLPHDPNGVEEPPMAGPYSIADWTTLSGAVRLKAYGPSTWT